MKKRIVISGMIICLFVSSTFAQKDWQIEKVSVINYGDGRLLFRTNDDKEEPLNGKHRIIDGIRSEYLLADFKNGMFDGEYKFFKFEKLKEYAQYKEGRKNGVMKSYFADGETIEKDFRFKDGKPDGILKTYHQNGKLLSEKEYKDGLEHGFDRVYDIETGKPTRDVKYVNGLLESGQTERIKSSQGDYDIKSNYVNGKLDGAYTEIYVTGTVKTKGAYKAGKKDGRWETFKNDGLPEKVVTYRDDLRHGETITFYTDGSIDEIINYADDKKDGISKAFFYPTGYQKNEFTFVKGKREGPYKRFHDNNSLHEEGIFANDTEIFTKSYFINGQLEAIKERKERKPTGAWTFIEYYDSNGKKRANPY